MKQKLGSYDLIAEYDLDDFMELKDGLWKKEIKYEFDIIIMIEDEVDFIFTNSRPIDVRDAKGINCMGCFLSLEFFYSTITISANFSAEFISSLFVIIR